MNWGGVDGGLMACRAWLEDFFTDELNDSERAAWLRFWLTDPPTDGRGRTYVLNYRVTLQETIRPAATLYAWANQPAVYYFNQAPHRTPPTAPEPTAAWSLTLSTTAAVAVKFATDTPASPNFGQIFYAMKWPRLNDAPSVTELKFATCLAGAENGARYYITGALAAIAPLRAGDRWTIAARSCGTGRGSIQQLPMLTADITTP